VEDVFAQFAERGADTTPRDGEVQDATRLRELEVFLEALRQGLDKAGDLAKESSRTNFYLLGLSPNQGRVAVRFFLHGNVRSLLENLRQHHADMGIEREAHRPGPEFPPTWMLLRQTARESKDIPPNLAAPLLRAVIEGRRYPESLQAAVVRRIRADREINYLRACVIKGCLVRNHEKEITMSLDPNKADPAYRLGRLFAVLEKTQEDALEGVNATVRDRFYSSASATPASVFPRLLRTYQHHLGKLEGGRKVNREKLVQEILDPLNGFPSHLGLTDQGLFAIGFYHQRQAFFRKSTAESTQEEHKGE
jgi:CRISPR-associated protein Csd1